MFAALKKYWVTARLCARQMSYFGLADLMGGYLLRLAQMAVMLMVWSALFHQGADMQGMTLNQMLRYTLLSSALQPLLDVRTPATAMLHSGELLSPYQRPRQLSKVGRLNLSFDLPLSFEQAAAYRKANGQYVRKNQWRETTITALIDLE